jgi:chromosome segregation ATPase
MVELKEIKKQIDNVRNEYNDYSVYNFEIKQKQAELDGLKDEKGGSTNKSKILKLEREINNLEILETDNVREAYPDLVASFNELSTPLDRYINQGLNNDKEAQRLRQEYNETKEKLINLAVEHNVRLKEKLDQLKDEIADTDYYKLGREISDNRMVQVLGYRTPETNYIRFYKSDNKEIRVPNQLLGLYEEALRKREAVKGNKPKSGLLSKLRK